MELFLTYCQHLFLQFLSEGLGVALTFKIKAFEPLKPQKVGASEQIGWVVEH